MNAVRLAASFGAIPRRRRWRYVVRVVRDPGSERLTGVLAVSMADPDPAAETAARTGHDESPRDDRPGARDPRRSRPAMVHRAVLTSPVAGVAAAHRPKVRSPVAPLVTDDACGGWML